MENTFDNNIHINQVYPLLNKIPNIHGLFINPILEISRARIGVVRNRKKIKNATVVYSPFPTYFFFSHWFILPFMVLYACTVITIFCLLKKIDIIHCRNLMSGLCGVLVSKLTKVAVVADFRGVHAEEGVLIGRWRLGSISYHVHKWIEAWVAASADEVTCISPNLCLYTDSLASGVASHYIPAMVDVETFYYDPNLRSIARKHLELGSNDLCLIYIGTIGTWHKVDALKKQISVLSQRNYSNNICVIILTKNNPNSILSELGQTGKVMVKSVLPTEVNYYLNAADIGLLPAKTIESESDRIMFDVMISSKAEEYLCTGLPVAASDAIKYFSNTPFPDYRFKSREQLAHFYQNEFSSEVVIEKINKLYRSIN